MARKVKVEAAPVSRRGKKAEVVEAPAKRTRGKKAASATSALKTITLRGVAVVEVRGILKHIDTTQAIVAHRRPRSRVVVEEVFPMHDIISISGAVGEQATVLANRHSTLSTVHGSVEDLGGGLVNVVLEDGTSQVLNHNNSAKVEIAIEGDSSDAVPEQDESEDESEDDEDGDGDDDDEDGDEDGDDEDDEDDEDEDDEDEDDEDEDEDDEDEDEDDEPVAAPKRRK